MVTVDDVVLYAYVCRYAFHSDCIPLSQTTTSNWWSNQEPRDLQWTPCRYKPHIQLQVSHIIQIVLYIHAHERPDRVSVCVCFRSHVCSVRLSWRAVGLHWCHLGNSCRASSPMTPHSAPGALFLADSSQASNPRYFCTVAAFGAKWCTWKDLSSSLCFFL